jgi:hypothetical protein
MGGIEAVADDAHKDSADHGHRQGSVIGQKRIDRYHGEYNGDQSRDL